MKKLLITIGKTLLFFVGWALLGSLLPVPESPNQAVWRFWAELILSDHRCLHNFVLAI